MALKDGRFLIDVYSVDQLQDFRLGVRLQIPCQAIAYVEELEYLKGHDKDINELPALEDLVQQLHFKVQTLSEQQ